MKLNYEEEHNVATRPVYLPDTQGTNPGVRTENVDFQWAPGLSLTQKRKCIASLHQAAQDRSFHPILEISSKSGNPIGVQLSAFNLHVRLPRCDKRHVVENVFQASKVFEHGGPYTDILKMTPRDAKTDARLKQSGKLIGFKLFNEDFPLEPRTIFYDWLYINALSQHPRLSDAVMSFVGFTDIEFNPSKSINCQAYAAALYVSLRTTDKLAAALRSHEDFRRTVYATGSERAQDPVQLSLL